jgi:hypothetical protein
VELELRPIANGDYEVYDAENGVSVCTSLDKYWMGQLVREGCINFEKFDKASLIKIINLLV